MRAALPILPARPSPAPTWSDEDLVRECLRGSEDAWSALVDKYKQLVYSIPRKYNATPEDAADIFQAVWTQLYSELPRLRNPGALPAWLIRVTAHQAYHQKRRRRQESIDASCTDVETLPGNSTSSALLEELEKEQVLREAIAALPPRCRDMIHMLFFEYPARPYADVARQLGLAVGSIGFIRGRCLKRLRRELEARGF